MPTAQFLLLRARRAPLPWVLLSLALLLGPISALYRAQAPLLDPESGAPQLTVQLLGTAGAAWTLYALDLGELLMRHKAELERWGTELFASAAGAAALAGLGALSLQLSVGAVVPGLEWIPIKLGALAAALSQLLRPGRAAWALPVVVWGAPQLRIEHLTAAVGFPKSPEIALELLYLLGLSLVAWALSYRARPRVNS